MGHSWTNVSAAPVADDNGYVVSVDMKVGSAYTLAVTKPTFGARHVTVIRTAVGTADTGGTIVVVGTDLAGSVITETLTVGADGVTVTGTQLFAHITSITGVGWVIDAVEGTKDTIIVGWDAVNAVVTSGGTFHGIVVNTTAAGAITISDARGTIAVLPSNVAVGFYGPYDVNFAGFLRVEPAAASNITVIHSGSMPGSYAMS